MQSYEKLVAIVILNYNGKNWLEKFLNGVIRFSNNRICNIYVADNASTDDSVDYIKQHFNNVFIIQNSANNGYASGYNESLSGLKEKYFVLLNSDVEVTENWIEPMLKLMEENPEIAACQPKILSYHEKTKFEYAGAAGGYIDRFGYAFCRGRIFDTIENDRGQYDANQEIFWASGCCLFIRSEDFFAAGGFDPDFFAHMEEIDLCWRLKNMNKKIFYVAESKIYHVGGGTLNAINPKKTYLNFRNNLFLLTKNLPEKYFYRTLFFRLILDGLAGIKFMLEGNFKHVLAIIHAHFNFYNNFLKNYKKRNEFSKSIKLKSVYMSLIVWEYYLLKKKIFSNLPSKKFYGNN